MFVAFIDVDSESVAIAILWRLSTPTVGVNSLGLIKFTTIMNEIKYFYDDQKHMKVYAIESESLDSY